MYLLPLLSFRPIAEFDDRYELEATTSASYATSLTLHVFDSHFAHSAGMIFRVAAFNFLSTFSSPFMSILCIVYIFVVLGHVMPLYEFGRVISMHIVVR